MASLNKVFLLGNLTRDSELTYTAGNTAICNVGMAVNRKWKDKDGNAKEEVCFVDLTLFGRQAETLNQYAAKGRQVMIEGRLNYRQWTDKEGKSRSKLDVAVENFQLLGERQDNGQTAPPPAARQTQHQAAPQTQTAADEF